MEHVERVVQQPVIEQVRVDARRDKLIGVTELPATTVAGLGFAPFPPMSIVAAAVPLPYGLKLEAGRRRARIAVLGL